MILDYSVPSNGSVIKAAWSYGEEMTMRRYAECYSLPENADSMAKITSGHSALIGENILASIPYGKGRVILLGTFPDDAGLDKLVKAAASAAEVKPFATTGNLIVSTRSGGNGEEALIVCETAFRSGTITLTEEMTDVLTGETCIGETTVAPYDIRVFVKK